MAETALITGASAGIGAELARVFARKKHDLVIVARSEDKLLKLANELQAAHGVNVQVLALDLTAAGAPQTLYDELADTQIDILVNNAGYATYGLFHEIEAERDLNMAHLNMLALTHLCKLFIPPMLARGHGRVMNVASTASFQPTPLMAVYAATKAYVLSLSEALAEEYRNQGITVTALCPGPTKSDLQERAQMSDSKLMQSMMSAETVAEQGYTALMKDIPVYVVGTRNRILSFSVRLLPRQLVTQTAKRMLARVGE